MTLGYLSKSEISLATQRGADAVDRLSTALGGNPAAKLAASALIEVDALGLLPFGIAMLDEWTADAAPVPTSESPLAVGWLDCSSCFAPLAVVSATLDLTETARQFGVAAVFLSDVRGFGRLAAGSFTLPGSLPDGWGVRIFFYKISYVETEFQFG